MFSQGFTSQLDGREVDGAGLKRSTVQSVVTGEKKKTTSSAD